MPYHVQLCTLHSVLVVAMLKSHYGCIFSATCYVYSIALCVTPTVPSTPLGVVLQHSTSTSLQVSWSAPTFSNGPNLTYHVEYTGLDTENPVNDSFFMTSFLESSTTSVTISGLVPFSTYTIGVRASTSVGAGPIAFIKATTAAAGE